MNTLLLVVFSMLYLFSNQQKLPIAENTENGQKGHLDIKYTQNKTEAIQDRNNTTENVHHNDTNDTKEIPYCTHPVDNKTILSGDEFTILGHCMKFRCGDDGSFIQGLGCSEFVPEPGCTKGSYDDTKEYPLCCPNQICDKSNSSLRF